MRVSLLGVSLLGVSLLGVSLLLLLLLSVRVGDTALLGIHLGIAAR